MHNHLFYDIRYQFPKGVKHETIQKPPLKIIYSEKIQTDQIKFL